jgi:hypothetical protein
MPASGAGQDRHMGRAGGDNGGGALGPDRTPARGNGPEEGDRGWGAAREIAIEPIRFFRLRFRGTSPLTGPCYNPSSPSGTMFAFPPLVTNISPRGGGP